jgi:O-antigen biosynthesis protein WbqP
MNRIFDISSSLLAIVLLMPVMAIVAIVVRITSKGPIIYWSDRIGKENKVFSMPKFRSMKLDTPEIATHLLQNRENFLTIVGKFLRKYSLDELPQLWSILKGDLSIVGPRPALYNQYDLIDLRTSHDVHKITPGLTGWAQVNGRDELTIEEKVKFDVEYLERKSLLFDLYIIWLTIVRFNSQQID